METATVEESKKTRLSIFFDHIDTIDRYFYGRKMKNFIIGSLLLLVIAPFLDWLLEVPYDRLTYLMTWVFFLFTIIMFLAWISAWRDESGNWTWRCAKSRLLTYMDTFRDVAKQTKTTSRDENLYKLAWVLFFGGFVWKAFQVISVFLRKPVETLFHDPRPGWRNFERFTNTWCWVAIGLGLAIMIYLCRSNPQILKRIRKDLLHLFGKNRTFNEHQGNVRMQILNEDGLVISSGRNEHIQAVTGNSSSKLFSAFVAALKNWNPGKCQYEYDFQNNLFRHLKKSLPDSEVEMEYPFENSAFKCRGDIVIDDTILIEMKRDSSAGAIQRAQGQIQVYSSIWKNRGPVILLLCDHDYEHAKMVYTPTMVDLVKLERPVLTVVAQN